MKQTFYERIGESVYREVLPNGLQVCVVPKPEHAKKYAFFATNYGGMDLRFQLDGTWHDTPAGVAHYLEHKMFDTREGNALQQLTANGASPNAFTSNAITGYYFESTEHFEENLRTLLSFVSVPYFTRESVEKERGIIGQEIGMIEEQHVTQYGALLDTKCTWLESLLMHEYTECYLYWSCFNDETDRPVKKIWEQHFHQELSHLHAAARLLQTYEKKEWRQVIPDGEFPELLKFGPQKEYIRDVLAGTVEWTADGEEFTDVRTLPADFRFFNYQRTVNARTAQVPSHAVIEDYLAEYGRDYRYEDAPHPVKALQDREKDNTRVGRTRSCTK